VFSVICAPAAGFRPPSRKKKFETRRRKAKSEYRIQDEGRLGDGIPNILNEETIRISYISATISQADAQLKQLLKMLGDIEDVARHIAASVGASAEWSAIVNAAEENGASYCKGLLGKPRFSALYGTYTVTLQELKAVIKARTLADQTNLPKTTGQQTTQEDGSKKYGGGRCVSSTKPPELLRKRQSRPKHRPP
jgi:hypothetical protein